jgi:CheY-like chemotaxis protein
VTGAPKTVLVVDDEPSVRTLLREALPRHLERFAVATASNGVEAVTYLRSHPVDVLVTDVHMPVMDGFELLAYVRNHHPNLPVVVLSVMSPEDVQDGSPQLGVLRVLRKPASPAELARHIREAAADTVKGHMTGVPLVSLLELMRTERKSCSLLVRSGEEKGRLHFLSGELVNAYAFSLDVDGEEAARHLLGLDIVTIDFERSLHNHERRIETPLSTLLLEVATRRDEERHQSAAGRAAPVPAPERDHAAQGQGAQGPSPDAPTATAIVADARSIGAALEALDGALSGLRTRTTQTMHALEEAAPSIERAAVSLQAAVDAGQASRLDERRIADAWREVALVAERLARAAEALASDDERD